MNGPEKNFWKWLRPKIKPHGDFMRHEDSIQVGIPDVSYGSKWLNEVAVNGWIELKAMREWPKKMSTIIKLEHFTPEQKAWLRKRGRNGGRCFMLLKVEGDVLLFHWTIVAKVGEFTRAQMIRECTRYWRKGVFDVGEFMWEITK